MTVLINYDAVTSGNDAYLANLRKLVRALGIRHGVELQVALYVVGTWAHHLLVGVGMSFQWR